MSDNFVNPFKKTAKKLIILIKKSGIQSHLKLIIWINQ